MEYVFPEVLTKLDAGARLMSTIAVPHSPKAPVAPTLQLYETVIGIFTPDLTVSCEPPAGLIPETFHVPFKAP
jgi:hypothetical protein